MAPRLTLRGGNGDDDVGEEEARIEVQEEVQVEAQVTFRVEPQGEVQVEAPGNTQAEAQEEEQKEDGEVGVHEIEAQEGHEAGGEVEAQEIEAHEAHDAGGQGDVQEIDAEEALEAPGEDPSADDDSTEQQPPGGGDGQQDTDETVGQVEKWHRRLANHYITFYNSTKTFSMSHLKQMRIPMGKAEDSALVSSLIEQLGGERQASSDWNEVTEEELIQRRKERAQERMKTQVQRMQLETIWKVLSKQFASSPENEKTPGSGTNDDQVPTQLDTDGNGPQDDSPQDNDNPPVPNLHSAEESLGTLAGTTRTPSPLSLDTPMHPDDASQESERLDQHSADPQPGSARNETFESFESFYARITRALEERIEDPKSISQEQQKETRSEYEKNKDRIRQHLELRTQRYDAYLAQCC